MKPSRLRQPKTLVIASFILIFAVELDLIIDQQRAQIFASQAQKTGSALLDFSQTRSQLLARKTNESFAQYQQRISAENAETQSTYLELHSVEVAYLRDKFARRGLGTRELDEFYQRPGSTIAIHQIGKTLFDMGAGLRSESLTAVVKRRWLWLAHLARFPYAISSRNTKTAYVIR